MNLETAAMATYGVAIQSFMKVTELPELRWIRDEGKETDWDFYFTVAILGLVTASTTLGMKGRKRQKTHQRLLKEANRWNPKSADAIHDFINFLEDNLEKGTDYETAIGIWVLVPIKGDWPPDEQLARAKGVGSMASNLAPQLPS